MRVSTPVDPIAEDVADRRSAHGGLELQDERIVRDGDHRDSVPAEQSCDRSHDGLRIDRVFEYLGADDPIEALGWKIELVDLALDERHVITCQVLACRLEKDAGDVDCRDLRARKHLEDM